MTTVVSGTPLVTDLIISTSQDLTGTLWVHDFIVKSGVQVTTSSLIVHATGKIQVLGDITGRAGTQALPTGASIIMDAVNGISVTGVLSAGNGYQPPTAAASHVGLDGGNGGSIVLISFAKTLALSPTSRLQTGSGGSGQAAAGTRTVQSITDLSNGVIFQAGSGGMGGTLQLFAPVVNATGPLVVGNGGSGGQATALSTYAPTIVASTVSQVLSLPDTVPIPTTVIGGAGGSGGSFGVSYMPNSLLLAWILTGSVGGAGGNAQAMSITTPVCIKLSGSATCGADNSGSVSAGGTSSDCGQLGGLDGSPLFCTPGLPGSVGLPGIPSAAVGGPGGNGFQGGVGGDATSKGGDGGTATVPGGSSSCSISSCAPGAPGGAGGTGADNVAQSGAGGSATAIIYAHAESSGAATATPGNGGNGGNAGDGQTCDITGKCSVGGRGGDGGHGGSGKANAGPGGSATAYGLPIRYQYLDLNAALAWAGDSGAASGPGGWGGNAGNGGKGGSCGTVLAPMCKGGEGGVGGAGGAGGTSELAETSTPGKASVHAHFGGAIGGAVHAATGIAGNGGSGGNGGNGGDCYYMTCGTGGSGGAAGTGGNAKSAKGGDGGHASAIYSASGGYGGTATTLGGVGGAGGWGGVGGTCVVVTVPVVGSQELCQGGNGGDAGAAGTSGSAGDATGGQGDTVHAILGYGSDGGSANVLSAPGAPGGNGGNGGDGACGGVGGAGTSGSNAGSVAGTPKGGEGGWGTLRGGAHGSASAGGGASGGNGGSGGQSGQGSPSLLGCAVPLILNGIPGLNSEDLSLQGVDGEAVCTLIASTLCVFVQTAYTSLGNTIADAACNMSNFEAAPSGSLLKLAATDLVDSQADATSLCDTMLPILSCMEEVLSGNSCGLSASMPSLDLAPELCEGTNLYARVNCLAPDLSVLHAVAQVVTGFSSGVIQTPMDLAAAITALSPPLPLPAPSPELAALEAELNSI